MIVDCRLKRIHYRDNQIPNPVHLDLMSLLETTELFDNNLNFFHIEKGNIGVIIKIRA